MQNNPNQPDNYYTQNSGFNPDINQPRQNYPQQNPVGYPPPQQFNGQYSQQNTQEYQQRPFNPQNNYHPQQAYNQPPYNQRAYGNPAPQYNYAPPPQPRVQPIALQPNGVPVLPLPEEKKHIKKQYNRVGFSLILNTILIYTMFFILQTVLEDILDDDTLLVVLNAVCMSVANIIAATVCFKSMKSELAPMFNVQKVTGGFVLTAVFSALALQTFSMLIAAAFAGFIEEFGFDIMGSGHDENYTGAALIISTIYTCILAPVTEEILFRGAVLRGLSKFNTGFAIIASAILFGLFHGNIPQFILATILGTLLGFITVKSHSIIPAIITHMAVNTTATIVEFLEEILQTDSVIFMVWSLSMLVVGSVVIIVTTIKHRTEFPKRTVPKSKRGFPLFMSSAAIITYIIIQIFEIIESIDVV